MPEASPVVFLYKDDRFLENVRKDRDLEMKKAIIILAIIVSVLCLTACSEDFTSGLGNIMGKMGSNIYGIKPDLRKAEACADTVKSSISKDEDGKIIIDYQKVATIADTMDEIRESPQRSEALNELLATEIPAEYSDGVREILIAKADGLRDSIGTISYDDPLAGLKNTLYNALDVCPSGQKPLYSEVVMVSLLDRMVTAVMEDGEGNEDLASVGKKAVDTIKVVAQISTLDILADIDVTGLVSSLSGKDIARDEGVVSPIAANLIGKTMSKVVDLISTEAEFDVGKFNKFVLQAQTLTAAYEMTCAFYLPEEWSAESIMQIAAADIDNGLTIEDFVLYFVLKINNALEIYSGGFWGGLLAEYMFTGDNYEIFSDLEHATKKPERPAEFFSDMIKGIVEENDIGDLDDEECAEIGEEMATKVMDNPGNYQETLDVFLEAVGGEGFRFNDMLNEFRDVLRGIKTDVSAKAKQFAAGFRNTIFTSVIMIVDADYDAVFKLFNSALEPLLERQEENPAPEA